MTERLKAEEGNIELRRCFLSHNIIVDLQPNELVKLTRRIAHRIRKTRSVACTVDHQTLEM